jgi:PiT family inorganic phosphate transporter
LAIIFFLTLIIGAYMAWNVGANDVANAMGTSVGSGALSFKRAVVAAAVFEFLGAVLVGTHVTNTVRSGIVHPEIFEGRLDVFALGMCSALLAAAIWLHLSSFLGLPVSTTHSIVGSIFGFGLIIGGSGSIAWGKLGAIVASWFTSPLAGGLIAFFLFKMITKTIFSKSNPIEQTKKLAPYLIFIVFFILALSFLYKGLKNLHLDLPLQTALTIAGAVGLGAGTVMYLMLGKTKNGESTEKQLEQSEKVFRTLQVITACYVAFAHGANDVANAVGPLAAVYSVFHHQELSENVQVPIWVLLIGGGGIVLGLAMYGKNVIETVGKKVTEMTPSRGFCAEFGTATTVLLCSKLGLPISTTHTLIGSVIGVGLARGIATLDFRVIRNILASWFITIPATAVTAIFLFLLGRAVLL